MEGVKGVMETATPQGFALSDMDLINRFVDDCRLQGFSPETIRSYRSNLQIIARFLKNLNLDFRQVDKNVLKNLLDYLQNERKVSAKTLKSYFSALSSFYNFLHYEELHTENPVPPFIKRYLRRYKRANGDGGERKLISVEEMAMLINSILNPRDKALLTLLAKTGIRREEAVDIDLDDIDWKMQSVTLKPKAKRSNRIVFFDDETSILLRRWIQARENFDVKPGCRALFVGEHGGRLRRNGIYYAVRKHAARVGLDDPKSKEKKDHFTPHCCRHWFTTHLRRNGMRRELIQELRGDSRNEAIDLYDHIDPDELRREYLRAIPRLGIT